MTNDLTQNHKKFLMLKAFKYTLVLPNVVVACCCFLWIPQQVFFSDEKKGIFFTVRSPPLEGRGGVRYKNKTGSQVVS